VTVQRQRAGGVAHPRVGRCEWRKGRSAGGGWNPRRGRLGPVRWGPPPGWGRGSSGIRVNPARSAQAAADKQCRWRGSARGAQRVKGIWHSLLLVRGRILSCCGQLASTREIPRPIAGQQRDLRRCQVPPSARNVGVGGRPGGACLGRGMGMSTHIARPVPAVWRLFAGQLPAVCAPLWHRRGRPSLAARWSQVVRRAVALSVRFGPNRPARPASARPAWCAALGRRGPAPA